MDFENIPERIKETLESQLQDYKTESVLGPSSGRISRTFRLRKKEIKLICKVVLVNSPDLEELKRIKESLKGQRHIAPFLQWIQGDQIRNTPGIPLYLFRPHFYTTLSDRLASRPWLESIEKLWIFKQLLESVHEMHRAGVVHGFLHTENIGLTSSNWLVLLDIYRKPTYLKSDDPTDYIKHFASTHKRCYIAPERFQDETTNGTLTTPMDIFSCGCILAEIYGEQSFDLGDLLEYRKSGIISSKLLKIESSTLRASAKHMMTLDPLQRLTIPEYLERLDIPSTFAILTTLANEVAAAPSLDARLVLITEAYSEILWACLGVKDEETTRYIDRVLNLSDAKASSRDKDLNIGLFEETERLLREIESFSLGAAETADETPNQDNAEGRSAMEKQSILVYIHMILADIRHVSRASTKMVGLRLILTLVKHLPDEIRLQRIVPVMVAMLQDQDPLVRGLALTTLCHTFSVVKTFSPSDSKIFSQYIFKRVSLLLSDQTLSVRVIFASHIADLAEAAHRFLDVTHAVRLYDAIGSDTDESRGANADEHLFDDTAIRLLDANADSGQVRDTMSIDPTGVSASKTLISSTYNVELSGLHETISRWVVHIATDQSELSSFTKRALLQSLEQLCSFFGSDGVMSFILPQILTFLNDRRDFELRASLFSNLTPVCRMVGRAATEEFVLPCLEMGLLDSDDVVVRSAMHCTAELIKLGILSRSLLFEKPSKDGFLVRYAPLLVHPSSNVRSAAVEFITVLVQMLSPADFEYHVMPRLRPYLRRKITEDSVENIDAIIIRPWTWERYREASYSKSSTPSNDRNLRDWTEVEGDFPASRDAEVGDITGKDPVDEYDEGLSSYLARRTTVLARPSSTDGPLVKFLGGTEISTKIAQNVMFPKHSRFFPIRSAPSWFLAKRAELGWFSGDDYLHVRTVADLGSVFGLSILSSAVETGNQTIALDEANDFDAESHDGIKKEELEVVKRALHGVWGSEVGISPDQVDTILMLGRLKALDVPPLPPKLGDVSRHASKQMPTSDSSSWRPSDSKLVATSGTTGSHTAPVCRLAVSIDNYFFVSGSHDGTCRMWKLPTDDSIGTLESSAVYSEHRSGDGPVAKINDIAMVESSRSVVSGASDGTLNVWRVDLVHSSTSNDSSERGKFSITGATEINRIHSGEGEVLAVSHFNGPVSSVVTYATQKGFVHSCDLRCPKEPFLLKHGPELGYLTAMAAGTDRQWIVTATNRGYVGLWDVRFQAPVKLWRSSRKARITRLAASYMEPPSSWKSSGGQSSPQPYVFLSSIENECGMYDLQTGSCQQCFRTVSGLARRYDGLSEELPSLLEQRLLPSRGSMTICPDKVENFWDHLAPSSAVNCMVGNVGLNADSFLITGGSDSYIRVWDFLSPSRCAILGRSGKQSRPMFERFDFSDGRRLLLCRQADISSTTSTNSMDGPEIYEDRHLDSIEDLKLIGHNHLLSCSRDSTIKLWK